MTKKPKSEYASAEEVVTAFQSSTFRKPKLTYGAALEVLETQFEISRDVAASMLMPPMDGADEIEQWVPPSELPLGGDGEVS